MAIKISIDEKWNNLIDRRIKLSRHIVKRLVESGGNTREMPANNDQARNEYLKEKIGEIEAINLIDQFNELQKFKIEI